MDFKRASVSGEVRRWNGSAGLRLTPKLSPAGVTDTPVLRAVAGSGTARAFSRTKRGENLAL